MGPDEQLDQVVRDAMHASGVPGVALALSYNGDTMSAGFGITSVKAPVPVTGETLFHIGSITKTYTTMAAMRLVDQGVLDLDSTVRRYLPEFRVADREASRRATIRHLLTHSGGWEGDFFRDTGNGDDALSRYVSEMSSLEQLVPVGTAWSYCNAGFDVAGAIIEQVSGQRFEAALKELVFDPLELDRSYFAPDIPPFQEATIGHCLTPSGAVGVPYWPWPRHACPCGGVVCSVRDLLQFGRFHLDQASTRWGGHLLDPALFELMHTPQVPVWGEDEAMGLGWFIDRVDGIRHLWSTGVAIGQNAFLRLIPHHQFAFAILTNANIGGSLITELDAWVMRHYLGIEMPEYSPQEITTEEMAPYLGKYSRAFADVEIVMDGKNLLGLLEYKQGLLPNSAPLPSPPPIPLAFCDRDRLMVLDGPFKGNKAEFIRTHDHRIGWLRLNRRLHRRHYP